MNTGIQDAVNLAWKLAANDEDLLDSYVTASTADTSAQGLRALLATRLGTRRQGAS